VSVFEPPDFEAIGQGVLEELNRRLGSPELAEQLPGTLLMKVAESYLKYLERKQQFEEAKANIEKIDPLEMIDQPGLTITMRTEILSEYIDDLEGYWRAASDRMAELMKEAEDANTDVV
jgi:hypothetical protein